MREQCKRNVIVHKNTQYKNGKKAVTEILLDIYLFYDALLLSHAFASNFVRLHNIVHMFASLSLSMSVRVTLAQIEHRSETPKVSLCAVHISFEGSQWIA